MRAKYLVVAESAGKIKTLTSILGSQYRVVASMGHVVDLPRQRFGIDLDTMRPDYAVVKPDVARRLRAEAQKPYRIIYLAADPDREGEAIAYHVGQLLRRAGTQADLLRVTFDALTPTAVKAAFAAPRPIDHALVDAQTARRALDRLVGYPASRLLWNTLDGTGLSAGRVQSVALRLVVERETAIRTFVARPYGSITGTFRAAGGRFDARLTRWQGQQPTLTTPEQATAVVDALRTAAFHLDAVTPKTRRRNPYPPFTTSTLQQAASSHLKLSPDATMTLAQTLYETGLITYLRTDSPAVTPEGMAMAHATITADYGPDYIGQHTYSAKGNAQEAHECIRPTDTATTPDGARLALGADKQPAADLYALIYRRFLASQMAGAIYHQVTATVLGGGAVFTAKGSRQVFDGFQRVYDWREESEQDTPTTNTTKGELPPLTAGESVQAEAFTPKQHWTRPPARYSPATLVRALEHHGVGRPSTYAATLTTLTKRGYVQVKRRQLSPTPLGESVLGVLTSRLPSLFAVDFTAGMETALDEIAAGTRSGQAYLSAVWTIAAPQFGDSIVQATLNAGRTPKKQPSPAIDPALGACPTCGQPLVNRHGKYGDFIGCSAFPQCRYTRKPTR